MLSRERDKTIADFSEILEWIAVNAFESTTIIGGVAVGAYAQERGETVFSADLDLLMSERDRVRFTKLAPLVEGVRIHRRPQVRSIPVLVLSWKSLEVNVLTESKGLPAPIVARERAWSVADHPVACPFDLLANKLALSRAKDQRHIEILRELCHGVVVHFFISQPGRNAVKYLKRFLEVEKQHDLVQVLLAELVANSDKTSSQGRKFLITKLNLEMDRQQVIAIAPVEEQPELIRLADRSVAPPRTRTT